MDDYQPLRFTRQCNVGVEVFREHKPPVGKQLFHGLPFVIGGPRAERVYAGFGPKAGVDDPDPVVIPIGRKAFNVIVAHTLIEASTCEGGREAVGRAMRC